MNGQSLASNPGEVGLSTDAIRKEITKILHSAVFANSDRLSRFLQFTVEAVLAGNADTLKEYVIGIEAYGRKPPYDPAQDSIVRTEARRLRKKLKNYYETEGKEDAVFIYFRPGSYVPVFRSGVAALDSPAKELSPTPVPLDLRVTLAVLPFAKASAGPLVSASAKVLTEELIHEFMKIDEIRVMDTRSGSHAASQHLPTAEMARNLGVQVIVEGTVRIEGNWLTVIVQFVDVDGFQIWSQRFEAQISADAFSPLLERMASALVSRVRSSRTNLQFSHISADALRLDVPRDILRSEALLDEKTPDGLEEALRRCRNIVQVFPEYARAHTAIARCYSAIALSGAPDSALAVARGKEAINRAIELERGVIAAQCCLGLLLALEGNAEEAEATFHHALSLGSYAVSERHFGLFLCTLLRFDEGWSYLQRAERNDPFSHQQKIACSQFLYFSREFEAMDRHFAESSMYGPQPPDTKLYLALGQARLGRIEQARSMTHSLRREIGAQPPWMSCIAELLALCGEKDEATRLASQSKLLSPQSPISEFRQARLLVALDDNDAALSRLSTAVEMREAELVWLAADPGFDAIRDSESFRNILSRATPSNSPTS